MPANFSTNPPVRPEGQNPNPGTVNPNQAVPPEPKSIRDYLSLARSQGRAPSFTNRAGTSDQWNPETGNVASRAPMTPQAIPEAPQSEYEKLPRGQRMKIDPYIRAQERVKTFLPEMFSVMFPGKEPGMGLGEEDMKRWTGAVEVLTGNLLKKFDKEYEWSLKNEEATIEKRSKDELMWQKFYAEQDVKGNTPRNPETQMPLTPAEFIANQMAIADEMKFKKDMAKEESDKGTIDDLDINQISAVIQGRPELAKSIRTKLKDSLSQMLNGAPISDDQLEAIRTDASWKGTFDQLVRESILEHQDEILQYAK